MSETKLLPCPLCGNTAVEPRRFDGEWSIVCADNRHMCEVTGMDKSDAIAAWNTRALTPKQQAADVMFEALKAFMELPHLYDDVCVDEQPECKVCAAINIGRSALAKAGQQ